jgi:hypothetical protein
MSSSRLHITSNTQCDYEVNTSQKVVHLLVHLIHHLKIVSRALFYDDEMITVSRIAICNLA